MKIQLIVLALIIAFLCGAFLAEAVNSPSIISVTESGRRVMTQQGSSVPAQAGNVSNILIDDMRITTHWQGYYGTVTGTISLADAKNNTLFNWQLADPSGEIYATNSSFISWTNITCMNLSGSAESGSRSVLNTSIVETAFNITPSEMDGINETFNYTYSSVFSVGAFQFDSTSNCPMAYTYIGNVSQQGSFLEVLMTDNTSVILTSLLEHNREGFNGQSLDFQMLVPTSSDSGTDYYMFVELN
jgi:hypothetical protein